MLIRTLAFSLIFALACGDDDGAADTGTVDTGTADTATGDSGGDDTGTDSSVEDAAVVDSGGDDAGGTACGARAGDTCTVTEYCDFPDNQCGAADGEGVCVPRPEGCPDIDLPECACDGTVYSNACEAASAGSDVNGLGGCTAPADTFACGSRFCSTSEYCQVIVDDTGMPPAFQCNAFPDPCDGGGMDCTCVADEPCGDICETDDDGNVTVTCPGG